MYIASSAPVLTDVVFVANSAEWYGGGSASTMVPATR